MVYNRSFSHGPLQEKLPLFQEAGKNPASLPSGPWSEGLSKNKPMMIHHTRSNTNVKGFFCLPGNFFSLVLA